MTFDIFDIPVTFHGYDVLTKKIFTENIRTVTCANTYYLNIACCEREYKHQLESFDLIHADGMGVYEAARTLYRIENNISKITGSDLYPYLLKYISENNLSLFIFGDRQMVLDKAVEKIRAQFPGIKIIGCHNGFVDIDDNSIIDVIQKLNPDVIFAALGSRKQEQWVYKWSPVLNTRKIIAMGGGLRVISGDRSRGPKWVQNAGLEWLIRLISEPRENWRRYLIGIPLFIYRVLKQKFK